MSGYSYGRITRYRRIVEGLRLVLDDMSSEDGDAFNWVSKALMIMQEKLDIETEEYYKAKEEEKADEYEWERSHQVHDPEDY